MPESRPSTTLSTWSWDATLEHRAESNAFARLWRAFMLARVVTAIVLLLLLATMRALGLAPSVDGWQLGLCSAYLGATLAVRLFSRPAEPGRTFDPQWVSTIGIDLLAFSTLHFLQTANLTFAPLFALPVLTASVMGSALLALGTAAGVTLLLLLDAWLQVLQSPADYTARFVQAGLTGLGYFVVALLANQLARRLAREEQAARRSQSAARAQAQVNELVIETLQDGVLVVGPDCRLHAANPAARALLGWQANEPPASLLLASRPGWQPLAQLAHRTFVQQEPQSAEVSLPLGAGELLQLRVRTRMTPPHDFHAESLCVMFLTDLRELQARLRTEKLAAMGRMSAAVAHEIRNPLAAITQANALLAEDLQQPGQQQLSALVATNAQRLARIVEDILDLARVRSPDAGAEWLALDEQVGAAVGDWTRQAGVGERLLLVTRAGNAEVAFQSEHLRRVLVNLLDNAGRYASARPAAIVVTTQLSANQALLRVWSDGAPLDPGVQRHLFEPFFSSESRSSGLGLYICRELCERHGATIGYRRAAAPDGSGREGNDFFIALRTRVAEPAAPGSFATIRA